MINLIEKLRSILSTTDKRDSVMVVRINRNSYQVKYKDQILAECKTYQEAHEVTLYSHILIDDKEYLENYLG